jgi:D-alanyl-D-alanine carboxypeptidase (penicillin-binding protein 5/6)
LPIGHKIKVSDLLRGIIIQSGNDACIVAAENIAGSEGNFVDILQSTAESLGMHNTMVANSTGWPHQDHRMSVEDLAILAKHIIKEFPEHYSVFSEKNFTYNNIRQGNRNPLLYSMPEADGLKTGHTEEAGFSLVASAKRGERRLIGVLAGLKTNKQRSEEAERIMNWGFREFNNYKILTANETLVKIPVVLGKKDEVAAGVAENVVKTLRRGNVKNVKVTAIFDKPLKASVNKGDVLGKVKIEAPELSITTVDLVALETVNKTNVFGKLWYNLTHLIGD